MQKYTIVFIALAGLITIAMAQPVEQQQQQLIVPALDSVVVEATSQAEAVRKVRQLLGGKFWIYDLRMLRTNAY